MPLRSLLYIEASAQPGRVNSRLAAISNVSANLVGYRVFRRLGVLSSRPCPARERSAVAKSGTPTDRDGSASTRDGQAGAWGVSGCWTTRRISKHDRWGRPVSPLPSPPPPTQAVWRFPKTRERLAEPPCNPKLTQAWPGQQQGLPSKACQLLAA